MRLLVPILVLALGCGPDEADNRAARCATDRSCDAGWFCYRGFCVESDGDAADTDAGLAAPSPPPTTAAQLPADEPAEQPPAPHDAPAMVACSTKRCCPAAEEPRAGKQHSKGCACDAGPASCSASGMEQEE